MNTKEAVKLEAAPLTGWRIGDAGMTVFGPRTDAPSPRVLLNGRDRDVVRLAAAAPLLLSELQKVEAHMTNEYEMVYKGLGLGNSKRDAHCEMLADIRAAILRATEAK